MSYGVIEGQGSFFDSDDFASIKRPTFLVGWGVGATRQVATAATPLPVRDPAKGSALGKGGSGAINVATAVALVGANTSRQVIEISNGGTVGVWLAFGATAVAGQGTYLPAKATG